MTVHVFVGPTLPAATIAAIDPRARIHPPVVHGDLLRLEARPDDVVVIVDGGYHQTGSVRHKEILTLLAGGVRVVGCSSMGALRASELARYGMVGNGAVFEMYRDGLIDADDEVAVAHGEGPEYRRFGEPLVNLRHALAAAVEAGVVEAAEATAVTEHARALPYTARTWRAVGSAGLEPVVRRVRAFLAEHPEHADVKAADAVDTLRRLDALRPEDGRDSTWRRSPQDWKSRHLYEWIANSTGSLVGDVWVEAGAVVRYRQLYDPDFPGRWRSFVFGQMWVPPKPPGDRLEDEALALAARRGVHADLLTAEQLDEWLADDVERALPPRERLCRVLVRSHRSARGLHDLLTAGPDLLDDGTRLAVAESRLVNQAVAGWGPKHSVNHLKHATLRSHLAATWGVDDDTGALTAAARDRGFTSLAEAVTAVRPFFLRHHLRLAGSFANRERP